MSRRTRKKGIGDFAIFVLLAVAFAFILIIGGAVGKAFGQAKQIRELEAVVEFYMNLDDKGTEFSIMTSEKDDYSYMGALGVVASGMKIDSDLKTYMDAIEHTIENIRSNSDKKNYYFAVRSLAGDVIYEKKTGNPPAIMATGTEDVVLHWPISPPHITSCFGWRIHPVTHEDDFHAGIDIAGSEGTPVSSATDGKVYYINENDDNNLGKYIVIEYVSPSTKIPYHIYYGHLSKIEVTTGLAVTAGKKIGEVGSTGRVSGPHLHFEIRLDKNGKGGYEAKKESLNPLPMMEAGVASNADDCTIKCTNYDDPTLCGTAALSSKGLVKNNFDVPVPGGKRGSVEMVLW
jgi:hypothetical protein